MDFSRGSGGAGGGYQPWKRFILDLDLATDPGDAGALVMTNVLEKYGLLALLGTMCCGTYAYSPGCASAINTYHGRADRIVAVNKGPTLEPGPDPTVYNQFITESFQINPALLCQFTVHNLDEGHATGQLYSSCVHLFQTNLH